MAPAYNLYQQKIDAKSKEWDAEVDLLKAKGKGLTADAKIEVDKKIEELSKARDELSAYWDEISDKAEDTWDNIKDEAEEKWNKLQRTRFNLEFLFKLTFERKSDEYWSRAQKYFRQTFALLFPLNSMLHCF